MPLISRLQALPRSRASYKSDLLSRRNLEGHSIQNRLPFHVSKSDVLKYDVGFLRCRLQERRIRVVLKEKLHTHT